MTQIGNLQLLAPEIQESVLGMPSMLKGYDSVTERDLRDSAMGVDWKEQHNAWLAMVRSPRTDLSSISPTPHPRTRIFKVSSARHVQVRTPRTKT